MVSVSQDEGAPSLAEQARAREARRREAALKHPLVQAAMKTFPDAKLTELRDTPGRRAPDAGDGPGEAAGNPHGPSGISSEGDERA